MLVEAIRPILQPLAEGLRRGSVQTFTLVHVGIEVEGHSAEPALAIELRIGGETSAWLTTVTTLGTAQDALTEGLLIEQYFPVPVGNEPVAPKG